LAAEIRAACADAIDATGALGLLGSAALLARCRVLETNDSLPLHLATAMDVPTVAVFGPTVPAFGFGPLATRSRVVEHPAMPCRPCHAHGPATCPLGHFRCMRELTVASVVASVDGVLQ
jgi:heptosyltransferase-2